MIAICYHPGMGQLLIRNVDDTLIDTLKRRAKAASTSLEAEARKALAKGTQLTPDEKSALIDKMLAAAEKAKIPGVEQTEGWILIREARDSR